MTLNRGLLVLAALLVAFYTTYHLFDSPEPWMDEGLIIQSAMGLLETGASALPVAPGVYEPAWYITTGFPVTVPLAVIFSFFGVSLEAARLIMALYIFGLFIALFLFVERAIGGRAAWLGFFLVVFFGPIYGHGRNVLGEVPGLFFILLALLPLVADGPLTRKRAIVSGIFAGIAAATKPIFLLFLGALLIALLIRRRELELSKVFWYGLGGVLVPLVVWFVTQFDVLELGRVFAVYANPQDNPIIEMLKANLLRFVTELQPAYFFVVLVVWVTSYILRRVRKEPVSLVEEALIIFSILVCLAYLRSAGFYRYFFPAQLFALLYLPHSLFYLARAKELYRRGALVVVCLFLAFQMYETSFRSWTALHYGAERTRAIQQYADTPTDAPVFIYQAPEIVPFMRERLFFQFVRITPSIAVGQEYASQVESGQATHVITPIQYYGEHKDDVFARYKISDTLDNYVTLTPSP